MDRTDIVELIDELEDMRDQVAQAAARIGAVENELTGATRERLRQVRAQLEIALGEDHDWMGSSSYTLMGVIDELRKQDDR